MSPQAITLYDLLYAPRVTGTDHPLSTVYPDFVMHYDVEVSGFYCSQFGHIVGLNLFNGYFDYYSTSPEPVLKAWSHPQMVTGYEHARWVEEGFPEYTNDLYSYMAPIALAHGDIDYLAINKLQTERFDPLRHGGGDNDHDNWDRLYFGMLNAGLRVGLAGGSDTCASFIPIGRIRTYCLIDSDPLTYTKWTQALAGMRTSLAVGPSQFMHFRVNDLEVGSDIQLSSPGIVYVKATIHVADGFEKSGTIDILQNGVTVASQPFSLPNGGKYTLAVPLAISKSCWLVARTEETLASAIFVTVGQQPICNVAEASYWREYCDDLSAHIDNFNTGSQRQAILDYIAEARQVFATLAICAK